MSLDKKSQLPLYAQLMKEIKDQIRKGTYKEGDQIPTEGELSTAYQVSRITVRRTIEELCSQGFLVKRQGKGTFVSRGKSKKSAGECDRIENDNNMSFSEACRSNGRKPSSHIISCHIMEMQEWQQDFFKPEHTKIYHIERILSADNLPIIYEKTFTNFSRLFCLISRNVINDKTVFFYFSRKDVIPVWQLYY